MLRMFQCLCFIVSTLPPSLLLPTLIPSSFLLFLLPGLSFTSLSFPSASVRVLPLSSFHPCLCPSPCTSYFQYLFYLPVCFLDTVHYKIQYQIVPSNSHLYNVLGWKLRTDCSISCMLLLPVQADLKKEGDSRVSSRWMIRIMKA